MSAPAANIQLHHSWRQTWPDHANHFTAFDGQVKFAHIHEHHMSGWAWYMVLDLPWSNRPSAAPLTGHCETAREAAQAAEACYAAVLAGTWRGMSEKDQQAARERRENKDGIHRSAAL
ncbi:hypothetical protein [Rhizobium sp. SL86]|uniref:hypothetical protein n=1 Tax=Rhizobium sp. SL86 TaxID=2995148 RepID=UPI002275F3A5|nr:hypothetical protein [Rhizobium sp. SL86]MCY1667376.1 hypothetical protein [Rhizobium sp. SL86]